MDPALLAAWRAAVERHTGEPFRPRACAPVGGGCINQAYSLSGEDGRRFFVKVNAARFADVFEAEMDGLQALLEAGAIRAPRPLARGVDAGQAWLLMEWLALRAEGDAARAGSQLAELHRAPQPGWGWRRDNYIGSAPQANAARDTWVAFLRDQRLAPQLRMARANGAGRRLLDAGERLLADLDAFFAAYAPRPSLLHGDLWGGNHAYCEGGAPVIFDPAVYCGDREADIAMTELFGGFGERFYSAYREAWPLDAGYMARRELYNLYHVLNHFNLFGGGYARQAEGMLGRLHAALG